MEIYFNALHLMLVKALNILRGWDTDPLKLSVQ